MPKNARTTSKTIHFYIFPGRKGKYERNTMGFYECELCGRNFQNRYAMEKHVERVHVKLGLQKIHPMVIWT